MPRCSSISNSGIQYTPVDSITTVVTPHRISQSVKRCRSSVNVAKTRTGFSSRSGGTATNISRAPTSIPAAFGSNSGRSSRHIPLFRLCTFDFAFCGCRLLQGESFICRSLPEPQTTARVRTKILFQTESVGLPQLLTTALRTEPGTTLMIGVLKNTPLQRRLTSVATALSQDA